MQHWPAPHDGFAGWNEKAHTHDWHLAVCLAAH
jgi:hypothetical protein